MRQIKYKGNTLTKDEVWINMMETSSAIGNKIQKLFGKTAVPGTLPGGLLKVKFYIYKKKQSWIECNGARIEFKYNILNSDEQGANRGFKYTLVFNVPYPPPLRASHLHYVDVHDGCFPKKVLIKHLLDCLTS
jgi:hypothetical protein